MDMNGQTLSTNNCYTHSRVWLYFMSFASVMHTRSIFTAIGRIPDMLTAMCFCNVLRFLSERERILALPSTYGNSLFFPKSKWNSIRVSGCLPLFSFQENNVEAQEPIIIILYPRTFLEIVIWIGEIEKLSGVMLHGFHFYGQKYITQDLIFIPLCKQPIDGQITLTNSRT